MKGTIMYLTRDDIAKLPASAFKSVASLCDAVFAYYSVGITPETAKRILRDFA